MQRVDRIAVAIMLFFWLLLDGVVFYEERSDVRALEYLTNQVGEAMLGFNCFIFFRCGF